MTAHDDDLLAAADAGDLARVQAALDAGADVDSRSPGGRTPLMLASQRSAIPVMEALVQAGASLDLQAALGETALIVAASGRGGESIELLLNSGADPNIGDRDEKTPLMWMVDTQFHRGSDTSASVGLLVRGGALVDDRDAASRSALMWAARGNGSSFDVRPTVLKALVDNHADVAATDVNGETAMFYLVRYIDDALALEVGPECIQVLLDAGAQPNHENNDGQTPLAVVDPRNDLVLDALRDLGFTQ